MSQRKGNTKIFQGFLDTGSELILFPRDPKHHYGLLVEVGKTVVSIPGVLSQVFPALSPVVAYLIPEKDA